MEEDKRDRVSTPLGKPGGLYDGVKLTRKGANTLAVVSLTLLVAVFVLVIAFGRGGISVSFDANGGTDVTGVRVDYGEALAPIDPPTREGYVFTGWYRDQACNDAWDPAAPVTEAMTLYAGWKAK